MSSFPLKFLPPVLAHRGVRTEAPENTLAAFNKVIESGAQWIETDVKLTHDGVAIVMHDDTLDRTTNGHGAVADMDWAKMHQLDAGSWFSPEFKGERIPQLAEVLRLILNKNLFINLELKPCPGRARATVMVALIETAKLWPEHYMPPLISSFDREALIIAAQMHSEWPRGLLIDEWHDDWAEQIKETRASTLNINHEVLTKNHVDVLKQAGLPILAYTVNNVGRAKELLHWGVTAVFSDNPKEIILGL